MHTVFDYEEDPANPEETSYRTLQCMQIPAGTTDELHLRIEGTLRREYAYFEIPDQ